MSRFAIAAAILAISGASAAQAAPQALGPAVSVAYSDADLATPAAFERLQQRIARRAEAFCRANPVMDTVSSCTRTLSDQLAAQAQNRREAYARASEQTRLARR